MLVQADLLLDVGVVLHRQVLNPGQSGHFVSFCSWLNIEKLKVVRHQGQISGGRYS